MKIKLPIIGEVVTGRDIIRGDSVETKLFEPLGGFLDYGRNRLSSDTTVSTKVLLANKGWVYRNNDAIAKEISKIDFELFTIGISGGEIVYNQIMTHPLLDLLDHPNPETTKSDAVYTLQSHRKLSGDAFWVKIRRNGGTVSLRTLPPDKITLNLRPPTPEQPIAVESYSYRDTIAGEKIDVVYAPEDIIHFKTPNPSNPFRGYGAVEAAAETIDLDNLTSETTKKFFQNGAITNFVLSTESKINDDQLKRLQAELRAQYGGASKAYQTMILSGGLKPVDVSYSNKDQEFLGQLEWYRDKIMYLFGNTKASLGMIEDVNRSSHAGSIIEWQRNTVLPDMKALVDTLNLTLVPEFGKNLVLGFKDPVPDDRSDDIIEVQALYPIGVLTLNESRELLGLDPLPDGDQTYTPAVPVVPEDDTKEDTPDEK